jgi:hypothetical protein
MRNKQWNTDNIGSHCQLLLKIGKPRAKRLIFVTVANISKMQWLTVEAFSQPLSWEKKLKYIKFISALINFNVKKFLK